MSHYTTIRIKIRDADALREVLERKGYTVKDEEGNVIGRKGPQTLFFRKRRRDFVFEARYERGEGLAIRAAASLGREVDAAERKRKAEAEAEAEAQRLQQEYAVAKVREQISLRGLNIVNEEQTEDGTVRMVLQL